MFPAKQSTIDTFFKKSGHGSEIYATQPTFRSILYSFFQVIDYHCIESHVCLKNKNDKVGQFKLGVYKYPTPPFRKNNNFVQKNLFKYGVKNKLGSS